MSCAVPRTHHGSGSVAAPLAHCAKCVLQIEAVDGALVIRKCLAGCDK